MLFDVGDTLLAERRYDLEAGIRAVVPQADVARAFAKAYLAERAAHYAAAEELPVASWLQTRLPALAALPTAEVEDRVWRAVVTLAAIPGVTAALDHLAADKVRCAAVSNAPYSGRVLGAELARHGLATRFEYVVSSADIGYRKPDARLFVAAIDRLEVAASETWFLGNTFVDDVLGAARVGLTAIWLAADGAEAPESLEGAEAWGGARVANWAAFEALYECAASPRAGDGECASNE